MKKTYEQGLREGKRIGDAALARMKILVMKLAYDANDKNAWKLANEIEENYKELLFEASKVDY